MRVLPTVLRLIAPTPSRMQASMAAEKVEAKARRNRLTPVTTKPRMAIGL